MSFLKHFLDSLLEKGLIKNVNSSVDRMQIEGYDRNLYLTKGKVGYFLFSSITPDKGQEIFTKSEAVLTRIVSNALFGNKTVYFQNKKYENVSVYPVRVIKSGVQFKTANDKEFIVNCVTLDDVTGLYDILYAANAESVIAAVKGTLDHENTRVNSGVDLVKEGAVSIRSSFLTSNCVSLLGDFTITPKTAVAMEKVNQSIGDTTKIGASVPDLKDLMIASSFTSLKLNDESYGVSFEADVNQVKYIFSGAAMIDISAVNTVQINSSLDMYSLKTTGVSITSKDDKKLLASSMKVIVPTTEQVTPVIFTNRTHKGADAVKVASNWVPEATSFKEVQSLVLEF